MSQSTTVASVIQRSAQILGANLSAAAQQSSATVIAEGNQIKDAVVASAANPLEASREITRTQVITQGEVPLLLAQIAANPSAGEVLAPISGAALLQKVQTAPVGDVQGDDARPGTFYFGQASFQLQTTNPDQANVTVYRTLGNRSSVNLTVALSVNNGSARATVPIAFADREISKTVDLTGAIRTDGTLFYQPTVTLRLALDSGAPPLAALGTPATATLAKVAPTFNSRMSDLIIIRNDSFTLSVSATGAPRPTFRWQRNGIDLPGETSSSLFVAGAGFADAGTYTVIVSNAAGSVSDSATVTVVERVRIVSAPMSQIAYAGDNAMFEVVAEGTAPLFFQCLKNESVIPGATYANLALKNLSVGDAGRYAVAVANPAGSVISPQATLGVQPYPPPTILTHVVSQSRRAGDRAVFSVSVLGTIPLSFEWQQDGKVIPGAAASVLELDNVSAANAGRYTVTVRNPYGAASSGGTLTVYSPPRIVASPQDREALEGTDVSFTAAADGSAPLRFAWFRNGELISGATNATLLLKGVRDSDAGGYRVAVSNEFGQASSPEFSLRVVRTRPPVITVQPSNRSGLPGGTVEFAVEAIGQGPVTYQWLKDEAALAGATDRVLTLSAVSHSDQGNYRVVVKNPYGIVVSSLATLVLDLPTVAISKPARMADGRFTFSFQSQPGRLYIIEVSTDLQSWQTLSGVSSDSTQATFTDQTAAPHTLRFYRVVLVP